MSYILDFWIFDTWVFFKRSKKEKKPAIKSAMTSPALQNLSDMKGLAGLDEDLEFHHEVEAKVSYYKVWPLTQFFLFPFL